ncbi:MAG TPA: cbb3-type cytochrome c oxidase subunit I [Casimicrobiaceae bacterium]
MPTLAEAGGAARLPVDVAFERFALALPRDARARLACGWFALCVCALAAAGVLAVLLVLSRTPGLARLFPVANFFHVALVAHVDLSVLVWFLSFAGGLWSLNSTRRAMPLAWIALALAAIGALVIAGSPFAGGTPIMSNYVPVIDGPVFMTGLLIFGAGVALLVARGLFNSPLVGIRLGGTGALRFGLNSSLVAAAVAALAFAWSFVALPAGLDDKAHYELLFWGGGHVLQFAYTLMMLVAWLVLAEAIGARVPLSPRVVTLLFAIGLVAVFATPLIYFAYGITSIEHHRLQTWLMRFGGGLAIAPVAVAVIYAIVRRARAPQRQDSNATRPLLAALVASLVLFGVGGVIGFAIHGSDVRIPAHYHGSIVAVTIALMGLAYWLLPRFGFAAPPPRLATWQAYLYGSGQLLHMVGLVWSGGYGVQRKVADGALVERSLEQVAGMALMGAGGLIAIAGGMLFVAAVIIAVVRRPRPSAR